MEPTRTDRLTGEAVARAGWCDVSLLSVAWASDGRDVLIDLRFPAAGERTLTCRWASELRVDLAYPSACGGYALSWDATFTPIEGGWEIELDFATRGSVRLRCCELELTATASER